MHMVVGDASNSLGFSDTWASPPEPRAGGTWASRGWRCPVLSDGLVVGAWSLHAVANTILREIRSEYADFDLCSMG